MTALPDVTAVIIDDEPLARDVLRLRLAEHPGIRLLSECATGADAIMTIRTLRPDVAFLDVRMPDTDGFEVVTALRPSERPVVVFVTAHADMAIRGFDARAVAYLVKPFDRAQFVAALDAALDVVAGRRAVARSVEMGNVAQPRQWVLARQGRRTVLIPVGEVRWIQADGDYARVHTRARQHLIDRSLTALEDELDPRRFVRVHRSTIANIECIRELRTDDGRDHEIVLDDGTRLRLSRTHRDRLERVLRESL